MSQQDAPVWRRRSRLAPATAAGVVAVAALAAVLGGCSASAQSSAMTCAQQYKAWKKGPADAAGKKLIADAKKVQDAGQDIPVMTKDIKAMGADAKAMEAYPMPACADPAGYWPKYLKAITSAGDNAGTGSGLSAVLLAEAALKQVPTLQSKLDAELAKTAGVKPSS